MRRMLKIGVFFLVLGFMICPLWAAEFSGEDIITRVNDLLNQDSAFSKTRMTIQTSSGQDRTFEFLTWAGDKGEKNLIRYTEPSRARDQAILMLNNADDIWMYFPRTRRVRKLATHAKKQKMQGSDYSYEDMGSGDAFITDFQAERLEDEDVNAHPCFKVLLERKEGSDSSYVKVTMLVRKDDFFPVRIDYYDEEYPDTLSKTLLLEDVRVIQGVPTAMRMVMKNRLDFTETRMELLEVDYEVNIPETKFTERALRE